MTRIYYPRLTVAVLAACTAFPLLAEQTATSGDSAASETAAPAESQSTETAQTVSGDVEATTEEEALVADLEAGAEHYKKNCRACHGPTAKGVSAYPRLVGQTVEDLTAKLELYRSGEKVGPNTMLMAPRAKDLTDQDIANITHWIASLEAE